MTKQLDSNSAVYLRGADVQKIVVPLSIAATELQDGDQIIMCELPSGAIVTGIKVLNSDMDTGSPAGVFDIGLYTSNRNLDLDELTVALMTLVDVDEYVDGATSFQAAITTPTEIMNGRAASAIYPTVRADAGDSVGEEPFKYVMVLEITVSAATAAAGTATFIVEYVQG